jgi:hypothetical protein
MSEKVKKFVGTKRSQKKEDGADSSAADIEDSLQKVQGLSVCLFVCLFVLVCQFVLNSILYYISIQT